MTRGPVFENYKVYWATTVAAIATPTLAEFSGAAYLGRLVNKDGVRHGISQNRVDVASIDELFDAQRMGSWGATPSLTLWRDDSDESDGWDIVENGEIGFLLIAPFGTPGIGDPAYVYPAEMGVHMPADSGANSGQAFTVEFAVTSAPNLSAEIAGS